MTKYKVEEGKLVRVEESKIKATFTLGIKVRVPYTGKTSKIWEINKYDARGKEKIIKEEILGSLVSLFDYFNVDYKKEDKKYVYAFITFESVQKHISSDVLSKIESTFKKEGIVQDW